FSFIIFNNSSAGISPTFKTFLAFSLNRFIEQYVSKQPFLPQLHLIPSLSITIFPSSNPTCLLAFSNFPFKNTAQPIPVPKHKNTASLYFFSEPYLNSASPAAFESFFNFIGILYFSEIGFKSNFSIPKFTILVIQIFALSGFP